MVVVSGPPTVVLLMAKLPDELEREFRTHYLLRFLNYMRVMWVLALLLWVGGALADPALFPDVASELRVVRIAAGLVITLVVFALWIPAVVRGPIHVVTMVAAIASGCGTVALVGITSFPRAMTHFVTAIVVAIVTSCFVTILRFKHTAIACGTIVAAYVVTVFWAAPAPTAIAARTSFALFGTTLVGLMGAYVVEQYARQNFAQRRALEASERRALEASRAKSVFLSNMSHELRTPLNAVLGFAQMLERSPTLEEKERESVSIIKSSGEHLLDLINDVLAIAKIEAGKVTLTEKPFDLRDLLRGVVEMIRVRTQAKGLQLVVDIPDDLPKPVVGDEGKLRQVLVNLLGNAVKFTEEGGVALRARWVDGVASFEVEDTGYGIAEEEIARLFEAFAQTESGRIAKEGTGLGLAISQNFVNLMGGRIRVRSTLGKGSIFAFDVELPRGQEASVEPGASRVVGLEGDQPAWRLLAVDDTVENRALICEMLRAVDFDVRSAANGQEAVEIWKSWRPHLIWMDIRMPVMDGVAATRLIRELEEPDERCAIVALTASAFEHDRQEIMTSGFDGFITKPYREGTIFDAISTHLGVRYRYERPLSAAVASVATRSALTRERLMRLPRELIVRLEEALVTGDVEASNEAAEAVLVLDGELGADLRRAVREYRFDELLGLLGGAQEA
jgi:two-component system sensor histidine kinase/response regulator